jgi:hypothetical protein
VKKKRTGGNLLKPIWKASYPRGIRLAKAGCALPYLNSLPGREHHYQRRLYVSEIGGYLESFAIADGTSTGYALALRIGTERACGAIVTDFRFVLSWEHLISWDYDPESVVPDYRLHVYRSLMGSPLLAVLNERKFLRRGSPVEGLLCGRASAPIPPSAPRGGPVVASIILADDSGEHVSSHIHLAIDRSSAQKGGMRDTALSGKPKTAREAH